MNEMMWKNSVWQATANRPKSHHFYLRNLIGVVSFFSIEENDFDC